MDTLARMTVTSAALYEKKMYTQGHWEVITVNPLLTSTPPGGLLSTSSAFEGVGEAEWRGNLLERGVYLF